jgi:hypothetical protein
MQHLQQRYAQQTKTSSMKIMKSKFKLWWSIIPPKSTKRTITSHLNLLHTKHTTIHYKQCYWWFRHICTTCPKVSVSALSWFSRNIFFFYWSSQFITDITELLLRVTVNTHNANNTTWLSVELAMMEIKRNKGNCHVEYGRYGRSSKHVYLY